MKESSIHPSYQTEGKALFEKTRKRKLNQWNKKERIFSIFSCLVKERKLYREMFQKVVKIWLL